MMGLNEMDTVVGKAVEAGEEHVVEPVVDFAELAGKDMAAMRETAAAYVRSTANEMKSELGNTWADKFSSEFAAMVKMHAEAVRDAKETTEQAEKAIKTVVKRKLEKLEAPARKKAA